MMVILTMQICIQCGNMCIIWTLRTDGKKLKVGPIIQAFIILYRISSITIFCLLTMQKNMVNLASGRSELIRKLCLLLLLAPRRQNPQDEKDRPQSPPLTPRPPPVPASPPTTNSHNKPVTKPTESGGTEGENQVPQSPNDNDDGPRPGKRSKGEGRGPEQHPLNLGPDRDPLLLEDQGGHGDEPPEGGENTPPGAEGEGAEGKVTEGEGEVEGRPLHPPPSAPDQPHKPDQNNQSVLGTVAYLLGTWEDQFRQLVDEIQGDLEDYWKKLAIPQ